MSGRTTDAHNGRGSQKPQRHSPCQEEQHDTALLPSVQSIEPQSDTSDRRKPMSARRGFASDDHAGVHPEMIEAIAAVNDGHAAAYGGDPWTSRAQQRFREHFGQTA